MEHFLGQTSNGGGGFQVALAAGVSKPLHTDLEVVSCMIWTPDEDVYINIENKAASSNFLLISSAYLPVPLENLNQINAISAGGATVYVLYRTK